jgi:hypothetical protein
VRRMATTSPICRAGDRRRCGNEGRGATELSERLRNAGATRRTDCPERRQSVRRRILGRMQSSSRKDANSPARRRRIDSGASSSASPTTSPVAKTIAAFPQPHWIRQHTIDDFRTSHCYKATTCHSTQNSLVTRRSQSGALGGSSDCQHSGPSTSKPGRDQRRALHDCLSGKAIQPPEQGTTIKMIQK